MTSSTRVTLSIALIASFGLASHVHAALRVVAYGGQQAPGMPPGWVFDNLSMSFWDPTIDAQGRVAFSASVRKPDLSLSSGIWSERTGALAAVARQGDQAPGASWAFSGLAGVRAHLNDAGHVTFRASGSSPNYGYFTDRSGTLAPIVLNGQVAPPFLQGITYTALNPLNPWSQSEVVDGAGRLAFTGTISHSGPLMIDEINDDGLYMETGAGLVEIAREGDMAGFEDYVFTANFNTMPFGATAMNDQGVLLVKTQIDAPGKPAQHALHLASGGLYGPAVIGGTLAPGTSDFFTGFDKAAINNAGQLAFEAGLLGPGASSSNNQGIWTGLPGALQLLAREGDHAPGTATGVVFSDALSEVNPLPIINGAGKVLFEHGLSGPGVTSANDIGLWAGTPGNVALVIREGDPLPSVGPGVTLNFFVGDEPTLNAAGQTVFQAAFGGAQAGIGLFAQDASGALQLIVRDGQVISLAPGVARTVETISAFSNTGNQDGRTSYFNDAGLLAFNVTFTDDTSAILVSDVVEAPYLAGDFQEDHDVDGPDLTRWRTNFGLSASATHMQGNADFDGDVDGADFLVWQRQVGMTSATATSTAVPEPAAALLVGVALVGPARFRHRLAAHPPRG
jgi:hypothetical protein